MCYAAAAIGEEFYPLYKLLEELHSFYEMNFLFLI